jgi:dihydrofolate synthase/folylpolyglutamate synthase
LASSSWSCRTDRNFHTRQPFAFYAASFPDLPSGMSLDDMMATSDDEQSAVYTPYERWVRRLYMTNLFHPVKLGLTNMEALHAALGRPMDDPQRTVVHVAGTNGKGSVVLKIAKTLELSNPDLKVGMFVSPHVASFRERMQVNGELITEEEVVALMPKIYEICMAQDIPATFFEITTALAFSFFAARETNVVVLETGLGGRLDGTNVVAAPALSIITSIGLEHTRILGDTIELIAKEKGGIIKEGRPVLVGPNVPHEVLRECASDKKASAYYTCEDILGGANALSPAEQEDYDLENARLATAALKVLQASHPHHVSPTEENIRQGTAFRPPCRFEHVVVDGLTIVLDVAHNPPAMEYLVRKLRSTYPEAKFRMVVGMSADKDLQLCGQAVRIATDDDTSRIHLVEAAHPRAAKLEDILAQASLHEAHHDLEDRSVTHQIETAMALARANHEILVVCGSVFLMAEAREGLGFDEPRDSQYIAEVAGAGSRFGQENFGNTGRTTLAN